MTCQNCEAQEYLNHELRKQRDAAERRNTELEDELRRLQYENRELKQRSARSYDAFIRAQDEALTFQLVEKKEK